MILPPKETAINTVRRWIISSQTIDQVECCELFIQDTIWMRYPDSDKEVETLKLEAKHQKARLRGE